RGRPPWRCRGGGRGRARGPWPPPRGGAGGGAPRRGVTGALGAASSLCPRSSCGQLRGLVIIGQGPAGAVVYHSLGDKSKSCAKENGNKCERGRCFCVEIS